MYWLMHQWCSQGGEPFISPSPGGNLHLSWRRAVSWLSRCSSGRPPTSEWAQQGARAPRACVRVGRGWSGREAAPLTWPALSDLHLSLFLPLPSQGQVCSALRGFPWLILLPPPLPFTGITPPRNICPPALPQHLHLHHLPLVCNNLDFTTLTACVHFLIFIFLLKYFKINPRGPAISPLCTLFSIS